uniref:(northern house mosquito) hypothetical protein n=1 Tax=Culex pipiens TaxID=7175 RepID=A0A8D8FYN1_CULPI
MILGVGMGWEDGGSLAGWFSSETVLWSRSIRKPLGVRRVAASRAPCSLKYKLLTSSGTGIGMLVSPRSSLSETRVVSTGLLPKLRSISKRITRPPVLNASSCSPV